MKTFRVLILPLLFSFVASAAVSKTTIQGTKVKSLGAPEGHVLTADGTGGADWEEQSGGAPVDSPAFTTKITTPELFFNGSTYPTIDQSGGAGRLKFFGSSVLEWGSGGAYLRPGMDFGVFTDDSNSLGGSGNRFKRLWLAKGTAASPGLNIGLQGNGFSAEVDDTLGISLGGTLQATITAGGSYWGFLRGTGSSLVGGMGLLGSMDGANANFWHLGDIFPRPGSKTNSLLGSYWWSNVHHLYPYHAAAFDRWFPGYTEGDDMPTGTAEATIKPKSGLPITLDADHVIVKNSHTPASSSATCEAGTIDWDASYIYVCTSTNTRKRAALSGF